MWKQKAIMETKWQQHNQYAQNLYQAVAIKSIKYNIKTITSKKLQALLVIDTQYHNNHSYGYEIPHNPKQL